VTLKKLIKNDESLSDLFMGIHDYYEYTFTRETGKPTKVKLIMSHYPMMHWNGQGHGSLMLHGHLHGSPCSVKGRVKDIGLDTNNLFPYNLASVVEELCKIEVTYDHHGEI
jgi:calcineurin-like phosphoesterase family protein